MLNKILVAIDSSAASQRVFETGVAFAKALEAELILVHALDVFDPASPQHPIIPVDNYSMKLDKIVQENYEKEWRAFVDHSEALLKQKQTDAEAVGIRTSHEMPYGRPGPAICKAAKTVQADLIVVGSRGRSGLQELVLGSVSNYIMHHATCSVTVVHPHVAAGKQDAQKHRSVVTTT
ncbi:MAG: universal stress protein [Cyanobacteria bacterium J06555_13]